MTQWKRATRWQAYRFLRGLGFSRREAFIDGFCRFVEVEVPAPSGGAPQ